MGFLKGKHCGTARGGGCFVWVLANKSALKHNIFYCIINQKSMPAWKKKKKKTILLISNSESKHRKLILAYELYDKNHFDDKQINNRALKFSTDGQKV